MICRINSKLLGRLMQLIFYYGGTTKRRLWLASFDLQQRGLRYEALNHSVLISSFN